MKQALGLYALSFVLATNAEAALPDCGVFQIGWALRAPKDGEIKELYRAPEGYTELWTTFTPHQPTQGEPGVPNLLLVFSVCYRGKAMPFPQKLVELRVQANRNFVAARVPDPRIEITINDNTRFDLTGGDFPMWTEYPHGCAPGDCVYSGVLVDLPVDLVRRWVEAKRVTGTLSGTPFELTADQQRMLGEFITRIAGDSP